MALTDEDLKFTIKVASDTSEVKNDLTGLARDLEKMQGAMLLPEEKLVTSIDYRLAMNKAVTDEMAKQDRFISQEYGRRQGSLMQSAASDTDLGQSLLPTERLLTSIDGLLDKGVQKFTNQRDLINEINSDLHSMNVDGLLPSKDLLSGIDSILGKTKEKLPEALPVTWQDHLAGALSGGIGLKQLASSALGGAIGGAAGGILGTVAVEGFSKLVSAVADLPGKIAGFAGVASPAALYRWEYTVRDFEGVIGRRMIPILDALTDGLRGFANVLDAVLPSASKMQELTSELKGFFDVITLGVFGANGSKEVLKGVLQGLTGGIFGSGSGDSFGAAARPAQFSGVEEFEKGFEQSALSASSLQGSIPEKQLTVLEQIRDAITGQKPQGFAGGAVQGAVDPFGTLRALMGW